MAILGNESLTQRLRWFRRQRWVGLAFDTDDTAIASCPVARTLAMVEIKVSPDALALESVVRALPYPSVKPLSCLWQP